MHSGGQHSWPAHPGSVACSLPDLLKLFCPPSQRRLSNRWELQTPVSFHQRNHSIKSDGQTLLANEFMQAKFFWSCVPGDQWCITRPTTVGSTRTPTQAMASGILMASVGFPRLRAPAPVNLGVRPPLNNRFFQIVSILKPPQKALLMNKAVKWGLIAIALAVVGNILKGR